MNEMARKKKVVIVGAATVQTLSWLKEALKTTLFDRVANLTLFAEASEQQVLKKIYTLGKVMLAERDLSIDFKMSTIANEALKDADFVLSMIGLKPSEKDIQVEKMMFENRLFSSTQYGLAAAFKSVDVIPKVYQLIDQINLYAEQAWLINLSEPSGLVGEAVARYGEIEKYIGVSTISLSFTSCLAETIHVKPRQLTPTMLGVSPMNFLIHLIYRNKDRLNEILQSNHPLEPLCPWDRTFLEALEAVPCENLKMVYDLDPLTKQFIQDYKDLRSPILKDQYLESLISDEDALKKHLNKNRLNLVHANSVKLLHSMMFDTRDFQVIQTVNNSHVDELEYGIAIEITARITKDGPIPFHISRMPLQVKGLLGHLKAHEQILLDALYLKDRTKFIGGLYFHPQMVKPEIIQQIVQTYEKAFGQIFREKKEENREII